jgi:hypothetical protein
MEIKKPRRESAGCFASKTFGQAKVPDYRMVSVSLFLPFFNEVVAHIVMMNDSVASGRGLCQWVAGNSDILSKEEPRLSRKLPKGRGNTLSV